MHMTSRARISKLMLVRIAVAVVAVSLLSLHFKLEIEMLGVLSWFVPTGYLLIFELPRAAWKQNNPDQQE